MTLSVPLDRVALANGTRPRTVAKDERKDLQNDIGFAIEQDDMATDKDVVAIRWG